MTEIETSVYLDFSVAQISIIRNLDIHSTRIRQNTFFSRLLVGEYQIRDYVHTTHLTLYYVSLSLSLSLQTKVVKGSQSISLNNLHSLNVRKLEVQKPDIQNRICLKTGYPGVQFPDTFGSSRSFFWVLDIFNNIKCSRLLLKVQNLDCLKTRRYSGV